MNVCQTVVMWSKLQRRQSCSSLQFNQAYNWRRCFGCSGGVQWVQSCLLDIHGSHYVFSDASSLVRWLAQSSAAGAVRDAADDRWRNFDIVTIDDRRAFTHINQSVTGVEVPTVDHCRLVDRHCGRHQQQNSTSRRHCSAACELRYTSLLFHTELRHNRFCASEYVCISSDTISPRRHRQ